MPAEVTSDQSVLILDYIPTEDAITKLNRDYSRQGYIFINEKSARKCFSIFDVVGQCGLKLRRIGSDMVPAAGKDIVPGTVLAFFTPFAVLRRPTFSCGY